MEKLRVLVVDDSAVYRKIISTAVDNTGMAVVEHTASNGVLALERLEHGLYDVVLLDVNMPEMDGIEALSKIKYRWPSIQVIMISGTGGKNAEITLRALELGAVDFLVKPLEADYEKNMEVVGTHLKLLFAQIQMKDFGKEFLRETAKKEPLTQEVLLQAAKVHLTGVDLIVIASSTGGPVALEQIFGEIDKGFAKPVLVVQHMPPDFTKVLAQNLDRKSGVRVIEGNDGEVIRAGQAILAPGGFHMTVKTMEYSNRCVKLDQSEFVLGVRPSADVLFKSIANAYQGARILAVVLTGMGSDGMAGVAELKRQCKCYCITQNEASCVVYGMPRSVVEAGLSDESSDIIHIARRIQDIAKNGS